MWKLGNLIFLLLSQSHMFSLQVDLHGSFGHSLKNVRYTKEIRTKQGRLKGIVVRPPTYQELQFVDTFLGVPYAEPPVGLLRFSPPQSPKSWRGVRTFYEFAPVCPQVLPNFEQVKSARYEYLQQILPFLENQSEDCLYLNIYAPHQAEVKRRTKKHPVIVFIHGESYEWNSGNPYDGTILAAHGNVVFVTINFRLGIIGFLRPGIRDDTPSNFGLLDQIAALVWIKDNIEEFGGDPSLVTLMGHGTGAIFANLLLISPIANKQDLFKRAILMSGSALNPDSIAKAPLQITKQVAHALNCPTTTDEKLADCLRNRDVKELLNVKIHKPKYVPAFATLIDTAVMPKNPKHLMEDSENFARYDLLYGVTELEKFHLLPLVSLIHGLLDDQRDMILRDHIKATHEIEAETILSKVLEHYEDYSNSFDDNYEKRNRDMVLEVISDSSTLAPLILTASLHSRMNPSSYMYVFTHAKMIQDYTEESFKRSVNGEELPYIFGVPLNKEKQKISNGYDKKEMILSEAVMNWWCNFAETGNPNEPRRIGSLTDGSHITGGPNDWEEYEVYWPQYDPEDQIFFNLTVPPQTGSFYRYLNMEFWNDKIPNLFKSPVSDDSAATSFSSSRGPRPVILDIADGLGRRFENNSNTNTLKNVSPGMIRENAMNLNKSKNNLQSNVTVADEKSHNLTDFILTSDLYRNLKSTSAMSMVIGLGIIFLIINLTACSYFYMRRRKLESDQTHPLQRFSYKENSDKRSRVESSAKRTDIGYKSASKPDINDVLKNDKAYDNNSNFGRQTKPSRNDSNSTIDTHIKVKEWIQQEIVQRCSPRFLRKTRESLQKEHRDNLKQIDKEKTTQQINNKSVEDLIYEDSPTIVVRPGKSALPKVSVAVDATPATRTHSILNQIPIEISKEANKITEESSEYLQILMPERNRNTQVVIEHHHSKSDPLPMDNVCRIIKIDQACSRMYESDSGSSCSLYAKVAPKTKSKMPSLSRMAEVQNDQTDQNIYEKVAAPTFITFGGSNNLDVNVTSQDPVVEVERVVTHEDALKTIKRRNYPKVLPDLEKRRSLPVKPCTKISYKEDLSPKCVPSSDQRVHVQTRNRILSDSSDSKDDSLTSVTNLHVGPLLKRPEKSDNKNTAKHIGLIKNSSIDESGLKDSNVSEIKRTVPLSRSLNTFSVISRDANSMKSASSDTLNQNCENIADIDTNILSRSLDVQHLRDHLRTVTFEQNLHLREDSSTNVQNPALNSYPEPFKIVIAPKTTNAMGSENNPEAANNVESLQKVLPSMSATLPKQARHAIIKQDNFADNVVKQPKIIIKPTTMSLQRNKRRNIPKVSAIPGPEKQNFRENNESAVAFHK